MSSPWKILRKDIVISTLGTSDNDMAADQFEAASFEDSKPTASSSSWAAPLTKQGGVGEYVSEYEFLVLAYDTDMETGAICNGTFTVQFIERADLPTLQPNTVDPSKRKLYAGRPAKTLQPTGISTSEPGCSFQQFSVRLADASVPGAQTATIFWRHRR